VNAYFTLKGSQHILSFQQKKHWHAVIVLCRLKGLISKSRHIQPTMLVLVCGNYMVCSRSKQERFIGYIYRVLQQIQITKQAFYCTTSISVCELRSKPLFSYDTVTSNFYLYYSVTVTLCWCTSNFYLYYSVTVALCWCTSNFYVYYSVTVALCWCTSNFYLYYSVSYVVLMHQ
jgi:hypothetical protein